MTAELTSEIDRYWFLTWTTYGSWLPGDARGFVSNVRDGTGPEMRHNRPGSPFDANMAGLEITARGQLECPPVRLGLAQAEQLLDQFRETARYRGWQLLAAAIMANHCHLTVGVPGDPAPEDLLRDFKSYGSRRLNKQWNIPASGTWWTESGSKRKLASHDDVIAAVNYVIEQEFALVIWTAPMPELNLAGGRLRDREGRSESGG